jgi:hypothetical protein
MKRSFILFFAIAILSFTVFTQSGPASKATVAKTGVSVELAPADLAKAALAAHGGDKLKKMKSLVMKGSVDVSAFGQAMPGAFSTAVSGELKQVYDGQNTYSSLEGFSLPPVTSLGFPLLPKVGDTGYVISALGDTKKKKRGFRMTTPEGFYTDFYLDEKTSNIKGYDSSFESGGRVVTTSVEVDSYETVEGIVVPVKYSQRFDLGPMTAYANFKTKTVLINSTIEDAAFTIPR